MPKLSRKVLVARIRENVGESDWDAEDILAEALEYMDYTTVLKFYRECHSSYWDDEE